MFNIQNKGAGRQHSVGRFIIQLHITASLARFRQHLLGEGDFHLIVADFRVIQHIVAGLRLSHGESCHSAAWDGVGNAVIHKGDGQCTAVLVSLFGVYWYDLRLS